MSAMTGAPPDHNCGRLFDGLKDVLFARRGAERSLEREGEAEEVVLEAAREDEVSVGCYAEKVSSVTLAKTKLRRRVWGAGRARGLRIPETEPRIGMA
jgi:hypothetical protein